MDGGQYTTTRSAYRQTVVRQAQQRQAPPEAPQPQPVSHEPQLAPPVRPSKKAKRSLRRFGIVAIILAVFALIIGVWLLWPKAAAGAPIDASKYQAVTLTNGQVYFGKLTDYSSEYLKLTDVYYIQTRQTSDSGKTSTDQSNQLIKRGNEVHGPEDGMVLFKDQVSFYENLKSDGEVAQLIDKYKKSH